MDPTNRNPIVAITMGDPCGVGPEILVKALQSREVLRACRPLAVGSRFALERAARWVRADVRFEAVEAGKTGVLEPGESEAGVIRFFPVGDLTEDDLRPGAPSKAACEVTVRCIERAVELTLAGRVQAVCTCPIHKANLHRHGFPFPGHTEFLSRLTGTRQVVMMLAGPRLRVSLATIHVPLVSIRNHLNVDDLCSTMEITASALMRDFGIERPRLGVAALNPHAGEEGRFGDEESTLIGPAVERCRQRLGNAACTISDPLPPDTVFLRAYNGEFDAVVAMYHDQGLIPLKLVHFHEGVNITLGMPIVRTSVDHGTAYDLAGTGRAQSGSLEAAILLAARMASNREKLRAVERP